MRLTHCALFGSATSSTCVAASLGMLHPAQLEATWHFSYQKSWSSQYWSLSPPFSKIVSHKETTILNILGWNVKKKKRIVSPSQCSYHKFCFVQRFGSCWSSFWIGCRQSSTWASSFARLQLKMNANASSKQESHTLSSKLLKNAGLRA